MITVVHKRYFIIISSWIENLGQKSSSLKNIRFSIKLLIKYLWCYFKGYFIIVYNENSNNIGHHRNCWSVDDMASKKNQTKVELEDLTDDIKQKFIYVITYN